MRYQAAPQPDAIRFLGGNLTIIAASAHVLVHAGATPRGSTAPGIRGRLTPNANAVPEGNTVARTIADQLVAQLIDAGVDHIYGIVGDSLNPIVDAVRRSGGKAKGGIDWVHVRHEEAGAFMAAAEAQLTGRLAVCAGSSGPGNTHLINGLYDAQRSKAPVLAIASDIPSAQIGMGYFQETHPERLFAQCSDESAQVQRATTGRLDALARVAHEHRRLLVVVGRATEHELSLGA